jgi:hypothetical protein
LKRVGPGFGGGRRADAFPLQRGGHEAPAYDVEAEESSLEPAEIERRLASGQLEPTDLVQERGAWVALADSVRFGEAASERAGTRSFTRWSVGLGLAGLLVALVSLLVALKR